MSPVTRTPRASPARGFGLAEAMVAITILAMIGALTYGVFARAMQARDLAERQTTHYHEVRQAMLRMTREISTAFISRHKDCSDPRSDTLFATSRQGGSMRLDFTSFSHVKIRKDANESDQNALSYFIDKDPDDPRSSALMRREKKRIDEEPKEGGRVEVLAHGIDELSFEFYDPKQDRWDEEWDSQNLDYRNRLPMFVRIQVKAKDLSGKEETFVVKTRIYLQRPLLIWGTGFAPPADGC
jgi:general secretion pathway protein J